MCFGLRVSGKCVCVLSHMVTTHDNTIPHTLELYYRVQEALDITVVYTISVQKNQPSRGHRSEPLPGQSSTPPHKPPHCCPLVVMSEYLSKGSLT